MNASMLVSTADCAVFAPALGGQLYGQLGKDGDAVAQPTRMPVQLP